MPVGFLTLTKHFPRSAEIHCMAVRLDRHGRGIGTALVRAAEQLLATEGVTMLQVKTQGPSLPCEEYARTTQFYLAMGFIELEEVHGLWHGIPTLILVKAIGRAN
jgi:GNAT superfamily N-acetyltransferase